MSLHFQIRVILTLEQTIERPTSENVVTDRTQARQVMDRDLLQRLSADVAGLAALVQTLVAGNSGSVPTLPSNTTSNFSTSTAPAPPGIPSIKRERVTEEDSDDQPHQSKRAKVVVDLTDD